MPKAAPEAEREKAVALAVQVGVSEAAKQTGWTKGAISRWSKEAGVSTVYSETMTAAITTLKLSTEERKVRLAERLLEIAELGTERTVEILGEAGMRDLVGAWTRAIHDAQLLTGGPTQSIQNLRSAEEAVDELAQRRKLKSA